MKRSIVILFGIVVLFALPACAQTTQLTKRVFKVNGAPVMSNPASVPNGTLLDFVLTYQYNPSPAPPAQAEIRDLLSSSLRYQTGSLNVPAGWSGEWFNGSWVTSEPANATGVGALTAPNPVPFGAGQTAWIPAPPAAPVNTSLGGDGYAAIPSADGNVYVVNHHTNGKYLDCFNIATGLQCTGYPAHVSNTAGAAFNTTGNDNGTPGKPYAYLDSVNRLYFPVEKINNTNPHEIGLLCADLTAKQSCGFHRLVFYTGLSTITPPLFHATDMRSFQGIGAVGSKVYLHLPNAKIGCLDTAPITPALCTGQPYPTTSTTSDEYASSSEIVGNRIYSIRQSTPYVLDCFDTSTNAIRTGSWPRFPDSTGAVGILYPLLNPSGTVTGMCALTTNPPTLPPPPPVMPPSMAFQCYDLISGSPVPFPPSYATWAKQYSGGYYQNAGFGQSEHYLARVFNGNRVPATIGCYDFATAAPCTGWTAPVGDQRHYKITADPQRPGCMWFYGDQRRLGSFDALDGGSCGRRVSVGATITPAEAYCATGGDISAWGQLFLNGLSLGGGTTATLSIYDGNNPSNPALNAAGNPYAQNLNVTSFPVTLGSGGLGIPYGAGPGAYKTLHIVLVFSGVTSNTPWTQKPPPSIEVTWKGAPPEICFQARVVGCENPTITNQATAVTTPLGGGASITATAPVTPLTMAHQFDAECPAKLTLTKTVPGAPSGFTGTFLFNVTCSTPNGVVQQQLSIQWPNTSVSLPNVPAGSQCTAFEVAPLPSLPPGYSWDGPPIAVPGNVIQITVGGPNQISFTNKVRRCNDVGAIRIKKQVFGTPTGFSGTFTFNVACWAGTTLITQQAQINYPSQSSVTVGGIPTGATCTVSESGTAPLPSGWFWQVSYAPASGQVSLIETCCPELIVINRAKFCCDEKATPPDDVHQ